jgi:hypothetical protein
MEASGMATDDSLEISHSFSSSVLISKKRMVFMLHIHGVMLGGHVFIENGE